MEIQAITGFKGKNGLPPANGDTFPLPLKGDAYPLSLLNIVGAPMNGDANPFSLLNIVGALTGGGGVNCRKEPIGGCACRTGVPCRTKGLAARELVGVVASPGLLIEVTKTFLGEVNGWACCCVRKGVIKPSGTSGPGLGVTKLTPLMEVTIPLLGEVNGGACCCVT